MIMTNIHVHVLALTKYNLVASDVDSCVYHNKDHIEMITNIFVDYGITCSLMDQMDVC